MSWEERLARAYESKLFKEYALVSRHVSTATGQWRSNSPTMRSGLSNARSI